MATDYNAIAEQYRRAKFQPWRSHVEAFTLWDVLGDVQGLSVLDLACGEGFYSRLLRTRGASAVTGVDLSEAMINLARSQEAQSSPRINYVVGDAREVSLNQEFDVVIAAYLLNYARNREELAAMLRGVARHLKPGGRFVTVNSSPSCDFPRAPSFRKYGFETKVIGDWCEGVPIHWIFHLSEGPVQVENYFLNSGIHEDACAAAGLSSIRWHPPRLSVEANKEFGEGYWNDLLHHAPLICLECVKVVPTH